MVATSFGIRTVLLVLDVATLVITALAAVLIKDRRQPAAVVEVTAGLTLAEALG